LALVTTSWRTYY